MPTARRRAHLLPLPLPPYNPFTAYIPSHTHTSPHPPRHPHSQERWHRNAQAKGELLLLKHKLHRERYATHRGLQPQAPTPG